MVQRRKPKDLICRHLHKNWYADVVDKRGMVEQLCQTVEWRCGDRVLYLDETRTWLMGVLNVTPDSFSDGGRFFDPAKAIARGVEMVEEGADIIDVGGESTRPGADTVPVAEELRRVIPVIHGLSERVNVPISIDTMKAPVAAAAVEAGATIINDVSALTADPDMLGVVQKSKVGIILMHMKGTPKTMQISPQYTDVVSEVRDYLRGRVKALVAAGVEFERIAVDPGIGFGKLLDHNLALIAQLPVLRQIGRPIVLGLSRKSFLGHLTGLEVGQRLIPGIAATAYAVVRGAQVIRTHDVRETRLALKVVNALHEAQLRYEVAH